MIHLCVIIISAGCQNTSTTTITVTAAVTAVLCLLIGIGIEMWRRTHSGERTKHFRMSMIQFKPAKGLRNREENVLYCTISVMICLSDHRRWNKNRWWSTYHRNGLSVWRCQWRARQLSDDRCCKKVKMWTAPQSVRQSNGFIFLYWCREKRIASIPQNFTIQEWK